MSEKESWTIEEFSVVAREVAIQCAAFRGEALAVWLARAVTNQSIIDVGEQVGTSQALIRVTHHPYPPVSRPLPVLKGDMHDVTYVIKALTSRALLPLDWYTREKLEGVQDDLPGIYEWRIDGVGVYIGKYGKIDRPTKEYGRNLNRMLNGQEYRLGKGNAYRYIHHKLLAAHKEGAKITLTILENVIDPLQRNTREQALIDERRAQMKTGDLPVLNTTKSQRARRSLIRSPEGGS